MRESNGPNVATGAHRRDAPHQSGSRTLKQYGLGATPREWRLCRPTPKDGQLLLPMYNQLDVPWARRAQNPALITLLNRHNHQRWSARLSAFFFSFRVGDRQTLPLNRVSRHVLLQWLDAY